MEQARRHRRVVAGGVREVELVGVAVEEEHGGALGLENLAALLDHEGQQLAEVEPRREGDAQLVEMAETSCFVDAGHGPALSRLARYDERRRWRHVVDVGEAAAVDGDAEPSARIDV